MNTQSSCIAHPILRTLSVFRSQISLHSLIRPSPRAPHELYLINNLNPKGKVSSPSVLPYILTSMKPHDTVHRCPADHHLLQVLSTLSTWPTTPTSTASRCLLPYPRTPACQSRSISLQFPLSRSNKESQSTLFQLSTLPLVLELQLQPQLRSVCRTLNRMVSSRGSKQV